MNNYRYTLEPYKGMSTRYVCPECNKGKTFSRYIDTETGEHLDPSVGRCSRENNCGFHYSPKQFFQDNNIEFNSKKVNRILTPKTAQKKTDNRTSFIEAGVFKLSLRNHDDNNFIKFLCSLFGAEITAKLIGNYFIGSSTYWNGATVFWQIDFSGKIRTGKLMLYNAATGKRVKVPYNHINWVHSVLKLPNFNLQQCLFGEHLLKDKNRPVAIVESEKTAIIASVYLPQFIWLAAGSLTNLNEEKCSVLRGRSVTLFPDIKGFEKWSDIAKKLSRIARFSVSDLLERKATDEERQQGLDLADYLIRFDYKAFGRSENHQETKTKTLPTLSPPQPIVVQKETVLKTEKRREEVHINIPIQPKHVSWQSSIAELEEYFSNIVLPIEPIMLNRGSTISDAALFIDSHLMVVKANDGKRAFLPYLTRLQELRRIIETTNSKNI